jgi:DNA polymerase I-like protein with 3'-5' exonuclease and polymerase domains
MIYTIGKSIPQSELYQESTWQQFIDWLRVQKQYQFDLETNITRTSFGRKIRTMQFGEVRTKEFDVPGIRFVIHWWDLTDSEKDQLLQIIRSRDQKKYIHNAIFEYGTMLNYGVVMENVFDTMLAEQIKWTGYFTAEEDEWGNSFFSLAGCMQRYFEILLDKSYQTAFIDEFELTPGHIVYAADDVTHLDMLSELQLQFLKAEGLINVLNLENEAVLAFGDITWNGMLLNKEKWIANLEMAQPEVEKNPQQVATN